MTLLAFVGGLLGIVVGLLLGVVVSLIGYLLMSMSPDVGLESGMENLYMLSTSLAMKGMITGSAIGAVFGAVLGLKKSMHGMMMSASCGCCSSGSCGQGCQCCSDHGNCMPGDKMGGCCREDMPMKSEKNSK